MNIIRHSNIPQCYQCICFIFVSLDVDLLIFIVCYFIGHVFQTPNQLSEKYFEYLDNRGYERSNFSPKAFDAIWTAAKSLTASIDRLQPNETLDQFSYDNEIMTKIFFDSLTRLQFEGASVSY